MDAGLAGFWNAERRGGQSIVLENKKIVSDVYILYLCTSIAARKLSSFYSEQNHLTKMEVPDYLV